MRESKTERPPKAESRAASHPPWSARVLGAIDDLGAILFAAAALITALGLVGWTQGRLVDPWAGLLRRWLGWGSGLMPLALAATSAGFVLRRTGRMRAVHWARVVALEMTAAVLLALLALLEGIDLPRAEAGYGGGLVGWGLARLATDAFGEIGGTVALALVGLVGLMVGLRRGAPQLRVPVLQPSAPTVTPSRAQEGQSPGRQKSAAPTKTATPLPSQFRKRFRVTPRGPEPRVSVERDERLPPLDFLERGESPSITAPEVNRAAGLIEKTLAEFGLPVRVVDFRAGPAVTQFAVEPGFVEHTAPEGETRRQKVRVSQISALASDLALALSAPSLRIEAPVPGQPYVGIEMPNRRPALVRLRPLLETEAFQSVASPLAVALGRDVAGAAVVADLASMPHLLVAGTTGSGKSVCLTALTTCLAVNNTPDDLRLVLIDPKMVELVRFNGLPHLLGKVETDLERIAGVLRWCTQEMDRRYRLLEENRARDLEAYNRKARRRRDKERLPRLVVILDELADLMMLTPDQTERTLVRLAQMARATGIHLVVATQRPSTDIVTGLIKANFPARISFAVASSVDSRVILDTTGAETLLGRGDMLFLSPEASSPVRVQGAFVSDLEIERLIDHWQEQAPAEGPVSLARAPWDDVLRLEKDAEEKDDILEQAIALVKRTGYASASMLQRRLRLGYPRAARLMDQLEELGVIGRAQTGGRTREVLLRDIEVSDEQAEEDSDEDRVS